MTNIKIQMNKKNKFHTNT